MTQDFAAARQFMIDGQLRANGVVDAGVLHGFATVPREAFVPPAFARAAYVDETIVFPGGFLAEPLVAARLLQAAGFRPDDRVLVAGDATGIFAALIAPLVAHVTLAGTLTAEGKSALQTLGLANVDFAAEPPAGTFSAIIAAGAVGEIPASWLDLLGARGRLLAVVRPPRRQGAIMLVEKDADGVTGQRALFDAELPYIPGHAPQPVFQF